MMTRMEVAVLAAVVGVSWAVTENCSEQLFAVHWTHVPKAGGTAMANLARRVACKQNPHLANWTYGGETMTLNPCCAPKLCVSEISCFATASTCPLVMGIGRHTSSMAALVNMPCCSREWFYMTHKSFFIIAMRPPLTDPELTKYGITRAGKKYAITTRRAQSASGISSR